MCRDGWRLVRCHETGFVFIKDPPPPSALEQEFAWEKTYALETRRREEAEPLARLVSSLSKGFRAAVFSGRNRMVSLTVSVADNLQSSPLHLLDVGCGTGKLMSEIHRRLKRLGREVIPYGVEVSRHLCQVSGEVFERLGGRVIPAAAIEAMSLFQPESIDVAVLSSFLEHEHRPLDFMRQAHTILRPRGAVLVKVPNYACWNRYLRGHRWCGFRFPDHVNYFTPHTLRLLAQEAGFRFRQRLWDRSPLSDSMYAVLTKPEPE